MPGDRPHRATQLSDLSDQSDDPAWSSSSRLCPTELNHCRLFTTHILEGVALKGLQMPWSRVLSFTDPFPYQATVRATDVEMIPTKRGNFLAELTQVTFDRLWMQRFHEMQPQVHTSQIRPGRKVIAFLTGEQPPLLHRGKELSPREIVVCNYDVMHHRTEGEARFGSMSLANDDFDTACKAIAGHEFPERELKYVIQPGPALMSRLLSLHESRPDRQNDPGYF